MYILFSLSSAPSLTFKAESIFSRTAKEFTI